MTTKIIFIATAIFILNACTQVNSNGGKTITSGDDTISEVDISLSKMDVVEALSEIDEPVENKLLFKASGIEPGWFAEFYDGKLRLVVNYAKDSVIISGNFKDVKTKSDYVFNEKNISVSIQNKPCVAAGSGNNEDKTVVVTYKGNVYKGCGSFVK